MPSPSISYVKLPALKGLVDVVGSQSVNIHEE